MDIDKLLEPTLENIKRKFPESDCFLLRDAVDRDFENAPRSFIQHWHNGNNWIALSPIRDIMTVNLFNDNNLDEPACTMVATKKGFLNVKIATQADIPSRSDLELPMYETLARLEWISSNKGGSPHHTEEYQQYVSEEFHLTPQTGCDESEPLQVVFDGEVYRVELSKIRGVHALFNVLQLYHAEAWTQIPFPSTTVMSRNGQQLIRHWFSPQYWKNETAIEGVEQLSPTQCRVLYQQKGEKRMALIDAASEDEAINLFVDLLDYRDWPLDYSEFLAQRKFNPHIRVHSETP